MSYINHANGRDKNALNSIKSAVSGALELPSDVMMDAPRITMVGNKYCSVENHRGIFRYLETVIEINSGLGIIRVEGKKLAITSIYPDDIEITGEISSLHIVVD